MGKFARLIHRHGWSLVALAAGLYLAARIHPKPPWADPDFTTEGINAFVYGVVASVLVILLVVGLAAARRTPRFIEAAAVLVGTVILASVVLVATDPRPATGTATAEGLPGQPSLASGSVECMGQSGQVTQVYARWEMSEDKGFFAQLLPGGIPGEPPSISVTISQGSQDSNFSELEGHPSIEGLAGVRGQAVLSYAYWLVVIDGSPHDVATGPGVLTFIWDCGQAPVLHPITSFLWWITGGGILPGFIVAVALLTLAAGFWWSRGRGEATPS